MSGRAGRCGVQGAGGQNERQFMLTKCSAVRKSLNHTYAKTYFHTNTHAGARYDRRTIRNENVFKWPFIKQHILGNSNPEMPSAKWNGRYCITSSSRVAVYYSTSLHSVPMLRPEWYMARGRNFPANGRWNRKMRTAGSRMWSAAEWERHIRYRRAGSSSSNQMLWQHGSECWRKNCLSALARID